jgi:hypothetical protein
MREFFGEVMQLGVFVESGAELGIAVELQTRWRIGCGVAFPLDFSVDFPPRRIRRSVIASKLGSTTCAYILARRSGNKPASSSLPNAAMCSAVKS